MKYIWLWLGALLIVTPLALSGCRQHAAEPLIPVAPTPIPTPPGTIGLVAWVDQHLFVQLTPPLNGYVYDSRIWRMQPDGSDAAPIPLVSPDPCDPERYAFEAPTRLPDGRVGYIVRCWVTHQQDEKLYMMAYDPAMTTVAPLHRGPLPSQHVGTGGYTWNPTLTRGMTSDGTRFVGEQLYWVMPDTTTPVDVPFAAAMMAAWSPDGTPIAFVAAPQQGEGPSALDAVTNLYTMAPDGTEIRPVVQGFRYASGVVWSPDSRWIALGGTFGRFNPMPGIWLIEVATGNRRLLVRGKYAVLDWSPDGHTLVTTHTTGTGVDRVQQLILLDVGAFGTSDP